MQKVISMLGILLTCLFLGAQSGHIYPQDIQISPNNKNTPSDITLVFSLDTSLAPTDYLRIIFPFRLNSIQPALWDEYVNCTFNLTTNKRAIVTASTLSGDSTSYFVQFYTDLTTTTLSTLAASTVYYLKITGTPDPSAQTGLNLPVQVLTVSNNKGNWIIYDSNSVFGTLTLADAFPSTMTVTIAVPSTQVDSTVLGASYKINVDITPKKTVTGRARVDIQFTNSDFSLLTCKSVNSTSEGISLLPATFQSLASNIIRATISKTLTAGNGAKYRFECTVRNPANTGTTKIIVRNRMGYSETITESGTDSVGLTASTTTSSSTTTTSGWEETSHKVLLGWGYEAHLAGSLTIFGLYKDASPTERWYQSVKTVFKPKVGQTATDTPMQVVISTVNDASFKILTATIYHNLPNFNSSNTVSCSVVTQGYLTCSNIGTLLAQEYWVSFRFNLLSTATVNTVSDFGKVRVQTQATSPVVLIALSTTTLANKVVKTNVALYTTSSTNGIIAYSTTKTPPIINTKYVTNGENVILKFAFKYFTNTFIPLSTANIERGIEFYTSQALASSTTPTCSISGLTQTTDIVITNCAVESLTSFTRLRFRIGKFARTTAGTPPYIQFTSTAQDGTISFDAVQFGSSQFSSLNYVNENVFDYYARWVQDFTTATNPSINIATGSSPFFFNSLVFKNGGLTNVQVGTTFFVTGASASDASNDGTSFPTLIRITGSLATGTIDEQTGTDRILLFFNDLEPLNTVTPCFGPTGIVCNYVANGVENTQTDSLTDYSGSRRIEIKIDPTQKFNIYIPVKTISQKTSMGFFVTTASTIDSTQGIFATKYSKRFNQVTSTMTTLAIDPVGTTPQISVTGSPTMGTAIDTSITGINSSYVPTAANTGSLIGAAYGYCANFDFTTTSGFTFKPFYTTTATPEQYCVSIKYSPTTTKDITCHVCPVHSTMPAANAAVTKFTLPTMAGQDFYDLVYVVGNNNGDFLKAALDEQATVMTAKTLSNLGITFNPTVFKKTNKNVYARVNFTTSLPLPKSIRINITPTGSSASLLITPVSTVSCIVQSTTATSCVTSGSATNIQIDAVAQGSSWAAGDHAIDFMIDAAIAAASISADTTINFIATIKVNGLVALSALHHTSPASPIPTFTIKNQASNYIGLYDISYLFGNKNARSVISFVFELPSDIKVYPAQTIVFNLGGIATANIGETPICFVRDYASQNVSNDFASCDVSDLTQLTLQAKATVTGNYTVEMQFIHIPSSSAPAGISAKVLAADGSTVVAQNLPSSPLTLPQTPSSSLIPALNVNLNRLYSDPGNVAEFVLSIRPSVKAVAIATHLYLYFPTYYADKLGYQNIWCIANDLPVQCAIMGSRIVHLSSFPVEVAVGSILTIRVYGVITPVVPSPAGKLFIGLADSDDIFKLTEQLEIPDVASSSSIPTTLTIDTFSATTQKIRETADYTIAFTTDAVGIRTTKKIIIDFPDRYGNILDGVDAPVVLLSKTGNTTTTSIQTKSIGSRFKITPPYDLDPKTSYTFVIKSIDNPENPTCYMDKPMISITDSAESVAISRTAPNIWNVPNMDYTTDATLDALSWVDTSGNPITMLLLSIGIFSQEIRVIPPSPDTFRSDITFSQTQAALSLLPDSLTATKGTPYLSLRVSATSSTFPRIILLDLNKDESYTTNIYSELPKLQLVLTNNKNILPTNAIRIVKGGTSLPYSWDLEALDLIPNTELKMDVSINQPTLSPLSVLGASSISFGPSSAQAGFTFTLSSTADALSPPSFTVVLGGTDSNNYQLYNSTVTVTVENPNTVAPVLSQATPTPNYSPTAQQFALMTDQMASVYWHVAYENELSTTDCLRVRSKYNEGVSFDSTSPTQAQYGVFYVYTENVVSNQVVSNLLSNEKYSYILCPANQLDYMGAPVTGTFTTKDNNARLAKVTITFTQALTTTQLTSMVCLFKKEFQLPDLNAVAMDGSTCLTSSVLDDKSIFDYKSISIYLNGDRRSIFDSAMVANLVTAVQNVSTQTSSTFLTTFNQGLRGAGLTGLYQSISVQTNIAYSLPTFTSSDYKASTTIFDTKVNLYGLQLSSGPGMFYAIATDDTTVVPTQAEIKAKMNGKDITSPGGNVVFSSDPVSITLTGLTADTDYLIYYYAATADRTQYVRVTDVMVNKVRTKPTMDSLGGSRMEMSIAVVMVMTIIAWLF